MNAGPISVAFSISRPIPPSSMSRTARICRYAWVGNGSHIMKGVTIGEGAVIGANIVVISDIPLYCPAMGNPAEVCLQNHGRPSKNKLSTLYEDSDFRDCGRKAQFRENGAYSGGGRASFRVSVPVDSHGPALLT
jgi:hypothetical protein